MRLAQLAIRVYAVKAPCHAACSQRARCAAGLVTLSDDHIKLHLPVVLRNMLAVRTTKTVATCEHGVYRGRDLKCALALC